jgi:hypothetical protein
MVRKMKIYTNGVFKIISIDEEPQSYVYVYEFIKSPFPKDWTIEKILTYHYFKDETTEKIYL